MDCEAIELQKNKMLSYIASLMPDKLKVPITNYLNAYSDICEIRLRSELPVAFTISSGNLITGVGVARTDIQYIIDRMTDGNYFKNEELMRSGFITLKYGIRVGICGDVFVSNGTVKVLKQVKYLNIRLPIVYLTDCSQVTEYIVERNYSTSILLFSPPCNGKTTVLRSLVSELSSYPHQKRLCVIDSNCELLLPNMTTPCFYENLSGYPKPYGINLAFRYMNPEYIICDEIGNAEEAREISAAQHCGVPFIASAHADSFSSLLLRPNISFLLENRAFDTVIKLTKTGKKINYDIRKVSEL